MIISGTLFPSIGQIRAKELPDDRWLLSVWPTEGDIALLGHEPATCVEIETSAREVDRISRCAPHLLHLGPYTERVLAAQLERGRGSIAKPFGAEPQNRRPPKEHMQTSIF